MIYPVDMVQAVPSPSGDEWRPRTVVVRVLDDAEAGLAILGGAIPVLFVLRSDEAVRQRLLDVLRGWALGSGGALDMISPNVVSARPAGAPPIRLAVHRMAASVEAAAAEPHRLTREAETQLIPLAAAGSPEAQDRLVDGYSDFATALALWLRPAAMSPERATVLAHEELEAVARWPLGRETILLTLAQRINDRLNRP